mmetsp:Transcript_87844/g.283723  ORF Transcript_87844/g.283723 Transcript_87844/m.283723 type:complete len:137 (+) Transcript_87844:52-462(+)
MSLAMLVPRVASATVSGLDWKLKEVLAEVKAFVHGSFAPHRDSEFQEGGKLTACFDFELPELLQAYLDASLLMPPLEPRCSAGEGSGGSASTSGGVEVTLLEKGRLWYAERNQEVVKRLRGGVPMPKAQGLKGFVE